MILSNFFILYNCIMTFCNKMGMIVKLNIAFIILTELKSFFLSEIPNQLFRESIHLYLPQSTRQ